MIKLNKNNLFIYMTIGVMIAFIVSYDLTMLNFKLPYISFAIVCIAFIFKLLKLKLIQLLIMFLPIMFYINLITTFNVSLADIIIVLMGLTYLIKNYLFIKLKKNNGFKLLFSYCFILIIGISISLYINSLAFEVDYFDAFNSTLKIIINIFYMLLTYIFISQEGFRIKKDFIKIWNYTSIIFSILCIIGVVLYMFGVESSLSYYYRATGTFVDPNLAASYILLSIGLGITYNKLVNIKLIRYNIILHLIALILTASRGGLISLLLGLIITSAILIYKGKLRIVLKVIIGCLVFITITIIIVNLSNNEVLMESFNRLFDMSSNSGASLDRIILWKSAFKMGLKNPITGVGLGQFIVNSNSLLGYNISQLPHNIYLSFFAETGIVGLGSLLWLPIYILIQLYRRSYKDEIAFYFFFSLISVMISAFSINIENFRVLWVYEAFLIYYIYNIQNINKFIKK